MRTLSRASRSGAEARPEVNGAAANGSRRFEHAGQPRSRGVAMAQNGSLVYVANHVNDVFALFSHGS